MLVLLQLGDWYTTRTILKRGGRELNPVAAGAMRFLGVDGFLGVKTAWIALLAYFALHWGNAGLIILGAGCVIYTAVVIHNWRAMKAMS